MNADIHNYIKLFNKNKPSVCAFLRSLNLWLIQKNLANICFAIGQNQAPACKVLTVFLPIVDWLNRIKSRFGRECCAHLSLVCRKGWHSEYCTHNSALRAIPPFAFDSAILNWSCSPLQEFFIGLLCEQQGKKESKKERRRDTEQLGSTVQPCFLLLILWDCNHGATSYLWLATLCGHVCGFPWWRALRRSWGG